MMIRIEEHTDSTDFEEGKEYHDAIGRTWYVEEIHKDLMTVRVTDDAGCPVGIDYCPAYPDGGDRATVLLPEGFTVIYAHEED